MSTPVIEGTSHAPPVGTRRTTPLWMTLIGALLLLALGFAAGALTMQAVDTEPAGLAEDSVVAVIEDSMAASNAGDEAAFAAMLSPDAELFVIRDGVEVGDFEFASVIAREMVGTTDLALTSEVVQYGDYASAAYSEAETAGVMVFEIVEDKIDNLWIFIDEYK
jgi:hypothetical protein